MFTRKLKRRRFVLLATLFSLTSLKLLFWKFSQIRYTVIIWPDFGELKDWTGIRHYWTKHLLAIAQFTRELKIFRFSMIATMMTVPYRFGDKETMTFGTFERFQSVVRLWKKNFNISNVSIFPKKRFDYISSM